MRSKEQASVQPTEQSTIQSTVQFTVQSTVQLNDTYDYGVGILADLSIGACVFFAYPKNKKLVNEKRDQPPKRRYMLQIL